MAVAVVVPAHNEEELIGRTVATLPDYVDHVVVVDDGSDDRTAIRAATAATGRPAFELIVHPQNRGVGAAIASGYRYALDQSADATVVVGADAQMDPNDMTALLDALHGSGAGYVKGNRLAVPGVARVMPRIRLVGNVLLTALTRLASGYWDVTDSQCGYTAINREALRDLPLDQLYPRYGYPNDVLARLNGHGHRVVDVPVRPVYGTETSGIRVKSIVVPLLGLLLRSGLRRVWHRYFPPRSRPVHQLEESTG